MVAILHGKVLHYYLNFSGKEQTVSYPYGNAPIY